MDELEATQFLGYTAKSAGIWLEGKGIQAQFKPDKPWKQPEEKKAAKYRSQLGDYDAMLPNNPDNPKYWDDLEALKATCYMIEGHPCLLLTEGFFKAIAGCANGLATIALLGVEMGLTSRKSDPQGKRYLVNELEKYARSGFGFIVAFDADCVTNKDVLRAAKTLARQLQKFDVPIWNVTSLWSQEEGKGMDDYIKANGADKFKRDVLAKAQTLEAWEKQFTSNDDDYQSKTKPPTPRQMAQELAEKYQPRWAFHNEQKTWRIWNEKYWEALDDDVFGKVVYTEIKARNIQFDTDSYVENTIKLLKRELLLEKWVTFDRKRYVAFDNGVLDMETDNLLSHSAGMRFTSVIPRQYSILHNLSALHPLEALQQMCPHTYGYMTKAMGGDGQRVLKLLAIINGILKWRFSEFQMFVHLVGEPGAGKGTFIRLLQGLVGKPNHRAATLGKLSDDYTIANIIDSQLVICPDEDRKNGNHGGLKALTGGDDISYREIYKKPASSPFYGGLAVVSNSAIFSGDTTGLERRLCLVSFSNRLAAHERNPKIEGLIESELSALTAVALLLPDIQVEQFIKGIGAGEIPEFKAQTWRQTVETNSAGLHLEERLVPDATAYTEVSRLYTNYREFCDDFGRVPMENTRYSQELVRIAETQLGWQVSRDRISIGGKMARVIRGVRLRSEGFDDDIPLPSELFMRQTAQTADDSTQTAAKSVLSPYENKGSSLYRQQIDKTFSQENFSHYDAAEETPKVNRDAKIEDVAVTLEPQGFGAVSSSDIVPSPAVCAVSDDEIDFVAIMREAIEECWAWEVVEAAMTKDGQRLPAGTLTKVWAALTPKERDYFKALKVAATAPENPKQMTLDIQWKEIPKDTRQIESQWGEDWA
ncbi:DUF3854 domain-containing protein [Microcoleus sp. FACHB-672]|nr:DUF3854 domain-containing protein [Microcoleus sp. FACHB-672]